MTRHIGLYFRGSVMHGVACKRGNTWVRKAAYQAMNGMERAHFIPTESSAIADNGHLKIPSEEQDDAARIKTQENQGRFSAWKYAQELLQSEYCLVSDSHATSARCYVCLLPSAP